MKTNRTMPAVRLCVFIIKRKNLCQTEMSFGFFVFRTVGWAVSKYVCNFIHSVVLVHSTHCVGTEKAGEPNCCSHIHMSQFLSAWT